MEDMYTAWRIAILRLCRIPWTTHCILLSHLSSCMDIELWFSKRCIKFLKMAINSKNSVVRIVTDIGKSGMHSVMGGSLRLIQSRFAMEQYKVYKT